jgi:glycosyltransferase involved in cell wall biosynthesis
VKVAFLVNDLQLAGGVGVILEHAHQLRTHHGFDVTLVLVREQELEPWSYEQLTGVHVVTLRDAQASSYDVAVATWWETTFSLFTVPARRYAYFVQSLEDRFYRPTEPERLGAALTLNLPVAFITEAGWIADTLAELRPDATVHLVRNGIDKRVFAPPDEVQPSLNGPLRVLVEGNPTVWFKHVPEALQAAAMMREPKHVTLVTGWHEGLEGLPYDRLLGPLSHAEMVGLYAETDVLLKLSSVEGMFGPPLEGMHLGATCVVTPVSGHEEYVRHGFNALLCDWDDLRGTARQLDVLARDRELLHYLRHNALMTARGWPSWEQQGQVMALILRRIAEAPAPDAGGASRALMADLRAGLEDYRLRMAERNDFASRAARLDRVKQLPVIAPIRRQWRRPFVQRRIAPRVLALLRRAAGRS